ncbi:anti-sigma regulatory factor [Limnochorda pilosa]|uniref:Serine/threonine protein kinase n=1 Tax=Limnochorda pilosa TaxID=1555112 RepID=A0A0K2SKX1_LIMPI|nr:anti-sigma regulatory factor [Limnochorda pilosa]BAS27745.1 serine/threonine protein kinase [Limnochorda pilosa]
MAARAGKVDVRKRVIEIRIEGQDQVVIVTARGAVRELARELGFGVVDQTRIATAVSEIVRNAVQYAGEGHIEFRVLEGEARLGLEIVVSDRGPGIPDVGRVLEGGFSTADGFGRGVSGARALVDDFTLDSLPGQGTRVRMRKWLP